MRFDCGAARRQCLSSTAVRGGGRRSCSLLFACGSVRPYEFRPEWVRCSGGSGKVRGRDGHSYRPLNRSRRGPPLLQGLVPGLRERPCRARSIHGSGMIAAGTAAPAGQFLPFGVQVPSGWCFLYHNGDGISIAAVAACIDDGHAGRLPAGRASSRSRSSGSGVRPPEHFAPDLPGLQGGGINPQALRDGRCQQSVP